MEGKLAAENASLSRAYQEALNSQKKEKNSGCSRCVSNISERSHSQLSLPSSSSNIPPKPAQEDVVASNSAAAAAGLRSSI